MLLENTHWSIKGQVLADNWIRNTHIHTQNDKVNVSKTLKNIWIWVKGIWKFFYYSHTFSISLDLFQNKVKKYIYTLPLSNLIPSSKREKSLYLWAQYFASLGTAAISGGRPITFLSLFFFFFFFLISATIKEYTDVHYEKRTTQMNLSKVLPHQIITVWVWAPEHVCNDTPREGGEHNGNGTDFRLQPLVCYLLVVWAWKSYWGYLSSNF